MIILIKKTILISLTFILISCGPSPEEMATAEQKRDVDMTWIEKYVTYSQEHNGQLIPTDYHFMAEIIYTERSQIKNVETLVYLSTSNTPLANFVEIDPYALTNGLYYTRKSKSYDDLVSLETAHPATNQYIWEINGPNGKYRLAPVRIGGPEMRTQVPKPSPIFLSQEGSAVDDFKNIDANKALNISWNPFTIGGKLEGTEWEDLTFALVSDCHGDVIYTSGAPEDKSGFADFTVNMTTLPADLLETGMNYVVFISQVNHVDANISYGIDQISANSFAVELKVKTAGKIDQARTCPDVEHRAAYLWSRKTPANAGLMPWPTFLDSPNNSTCDNC